MIIRVCLIPALFLGLSVQLDTTESELSLVYNESHRVFLWEIIIFIRFLDSQSCLLFYVVHFHVITFNRCLNICINSYILSLFLDARWRRVFLCLMFVLNLSCRLSRRVFFSSLTKLFFLSLFSILLLVIVCGLREISRRFILLFLSHFHLFPFFFFFFFFFSNCRSFCDFLSLFFVW